MLYYHLVFHCACVAQLAEQLTRNEQVAGSNPATSSKSSIPDRGAAFLLPAPDGAEPHDYMVFRYLFGKNCQFRRKYFPKPQENTSISVLGSC